MISHRARLLTSAPLATAAALLLLLPSGAVAQAAAAQQPVTHPTSTPYTGDLSIFDEPNRDKLLHTDRILDVLRLGPGKVFADIGAGGGWFTVRAARRVAPGGRVIAEDINQHAIDTIRERAGREHLNDVETVLGTPDDPRLPADSLNAALMLRVYHEVAHPPVVLAHLHDALKVHGLFAVIDHDGRGDDHGIMADVVRAEVERNGFHFVRRYDFTHADQNDYLLLFEKK